MVQYIIEDFFIGDTFDIDWVFCESVPELMKLKDCEQNPVWHSEGNAWNHTKCVVEQCKNILDRNKRMTLETKRIIMLACLFHDVGKGVTTEFVKGNWHAYGHEYAGEKIFRRLFWDIPVRTRELICAMIYYHMEIIRIMNHKDPIPHVIKIQEEFKVLGSDMEELFILKKCDILGSIRDKNSESTSCDNDLNLLSDIQNLFDATSKLNVFNPYRRSVIEHNTVDYKQNVYIMVGLPGAGKDTYIKGALNEDSVSISRDDIRIELGICDETEKMFGSKEEEKRVTDVFNERLHKALKEGKNVYINNLNLVKKYRDELVKEIKSKYKVRIVFIYVQANSISDNIERRKGQIKKEVFELMIDKFNFPHIEEYDKMLWIV